MFEKEAKRSFKAFERYDEVNEQHAEAQKIIEELKQQVEKLNMNKKEKAGMTEEKRKKKVYISGRITVLEEGIYVSLDIQKDTE